MGYLSVMQAFLVMLEFLEFISSPLGLILMLWTGGYWFLTL
jgi:hypothetical protein